jgi:hypothetical protein
VGKEYDEEYVEIVLEEISDDCKRILATMQSTLKNLDAMIATLEKKPQDFAI